MLSLTYVRVVMADPLWDTRNLDNLSEVSLPVGYSGLVGGCEQMMDPLVGGAGMVTLL